MKTIKDLYEAYVECYNQVSNDKISIEEAQKQVNELDSIRKKINKEIAKAKKLENKSKLKND